MRKSKLLRLIVIMLLVLVCGCLAAAALQERPTVEAPAIPQPTPTIYQVPTGTARPAPTQAPTQDTSPADLLFYSQATQLMDNIGSDGQVIVSIMTMISNDPTLVLDQGTMAKFNTTCLHMSAQASQLADLEPPVQYKEAGPLFDRLDWTMRQMCTSYMAGFREVDPQKIMLGVDYTSQATDLVNQIGDIFTESR
jgi:hypothetical protein